MTSPTVGPLSLLNGASIPGLSDSTTVGFDPFADNRKTSSNTVNIGGKFDLAALMPLVIVAVVGLIAWKFLAK